MKVVSFFWQFVLGHPLFWARFTGLLLLVASPLILGQDSTASCRGLIDHRKSFNVFLFNFCYGNFLDESSGRISFRFLLILHDLVNILQYVSKYQAQGDD